MNQFFNGRQIVQIHTVADDPQLQNDFRKEIEQAKAFSVQVFMLVFDDSEMAGKLIEQAYDLGLFRKSTQLFGTEAVTSPKSISKVKTCHKLNFSAFSTDGSDIYPYAPHSYDAVYGLAHALNHLLEVNRALTLDGSALVNSFVDHNVVNFQGVTGTFEIMPGDAEYPFDTRGNREVGVAYKILNYNAEAEDLVFVGKYVDETV
eukprot:gene69218-biopygen681